MTKINTDINKAPIEETIIIKMINGREYIGQVVELSSGKRFYSILLTLMTPLHVI